MITVLQAPFDVDDATLLRDLFSKRYELFIEGRGWRALARPDRLDIDRYDDDHTIYVVKQIDGQIVGGARLRPTVLPHMLKEVFGDLCDAGGPPEGSTVYECSRTFVARRHPERRAIFAEVLLAAADFCVAKGIDKLTGILETWWLNSYLALGLSAAPLGIPRDVEGMSLLAVSFDINADVRDNLRARLASINAASLEAKRKRLTLRAA